MNEKGGEIFAKKATANIKEYINSNYNEISNNIKIESPKYYSGTFKSKIYSKDNKNHFFYILYKKGKISDTYKKDYLEGKSILTYKNNILKKEIKDLTDINCLVKEVTKLNNYTKEVQKEIITKDNLLQLKYYYLEYDIKVNNWNENSISEEIIKNINIFNKNKITPKYFNITITSTKNITKSIKIMNIKESFINNEQNKNIIKDILNNNDSNLLKENNISYKYLN